MSVRSRKFKWILACAAEAFAGWDARRAELNEEFAIEFLWITTKFIEIAHRYLSERSPLSNGWRAKRNLQLAIKGLEDDALRIHEDVSGCLTNHGMDHNAQTMRMASLET